MNAQECGFVTPENYQTYDNILNQNPSNITSNPNSSTNIIDTNSCINICFRILRDDNGTNAAINPNIIPQVLAEMNAHFNPQGISFIQIGTFDYINNTNYNNYIAGSSPTNIPNCFNVYFIKNFSTLGTSVGGIASFGTRRAVIKGSVALNGNTSHEIGHGLNLLHTFQCTYVPQDPCTENPLSTNPTDCITKGDRVCDTPVDYNPFQGTSTTALPYPLANYNPDQLNIMSYWTNKNHFSTGQGTRMKNAIAGASELQSIRSYNCAPQIKGSNVICKTGNNIYSVPTYGTATFNWLVSGNLHIVGANSNSSVNIIYQNNNSQYNIITLIINGNIFRYKGVTVPTNNIITPLIGSYDWISTNYGNMGLIAPLDITQGEIASYEWEIIEDSQNSSSCASSMKPYFVGAREGAVNKFTSTTNQAIVNWGSCSKSYLIKCSAIPYCGDIIIYPQRYVDVGDSRNNPCYKNSIFTIISPNPIQNGVINVVLNKPSQTSPCNYKDLSEPQYFNSEIDEINNSVSIFNYNGTEVYRKVFETNEFVIDDAHLQSGNNYVVNLYTKEGGFTQQVIIVE